MPDNQDLAEAFNDFQVQAIPTLGAVIGRRFPNLGRRVDAYLEHARTLDKKLIADISSEGQLRCTFPILCGIRLKPP